MPPSGHLAAVGPGAASYPTAFAQWFSAADFLVGQPVGHRMWLAIEAEPRQSLLGVVRETYRPRTVVAAADEAADARWSSACSRSAIRSTASAAAYVCHGFVCRLPTAEPETVRQLLAEG